ncbi:hypothetical protein Tco_0203805 [Tanacetum coccineum]
MGASKPSNESLSGTVQRCVLSIYNNLQVIYLGNHLFSDLRGPSKAGWRTTAIIHVPYGIDSQTSCITIMAPILCLET